MITNTIKPIPLTLLSTLIQETVDAVLEQKVSSGFIEKIGEDMVADAVRDGISIFAAKLTANGWVVS
jgi:hypothetical protein